MTLMHLKKVAGGLALVASLVSPAVAAAPSLKVGGVTVTGLPTNQPVSTTESVPTVGFGTLTIAMTVQNTGAVPATGCVGWLRVNKFPALNNAYFEVKQPLPDLAPGQTTTMFFTVPSSPGGESVGSAMVWTGGAAKAYKLADNSFHYNVANVARPNRGSKHH